MNENREEIVWAAVFAHAWEPRSMRRGQTFRDWTAEAVKTADRAVLELRRHQHLHREEGQACELCREPLDKGVHREEACFDEFGKQIYPRVGLLPRDEQKSNAPKKRCILDGLTDPDPVNSMLDIATEIASLRPADAPSRRRWQGWDMRSALRAFASRLRPFKMDVVEDLERLANEIGDDDPKAWREAIETALGVEPDPENHTPEWAFAAVKERW